MSLFRFLIYAVTLIVLTIATPEAKEDMSKSDMLLVAFAQTCLKYPGKPDALMARLDSQEKPSLPKLQPKASQAFLGKFEGNGWVLPPQLGNAVLIVRNDGVCSIFVRRWDDKSFVPKLEKLFNDKDSTVSLKEKSRIDSVMSTIVWGLYPAGKYKDLLESKGMNANNEMFGIVLSTSDKTSGNFQLVITLAVAQSTK